VVILPGVRSAPFRSWGGNVKSDPGMQPRDGHGTRGDQSTAGPKGVGARKLPTKGGGVLPGTYTKNPIGTVKIKKKDWATALWAI